MTGRKFTTGLYNAFIILILLVAFLALLFISVNSVLYRVHLSVESNSPSLVHNAAGAVTFVVLLFLAFLLYRHVLPHMKEWQLFLILCLIYAAAGAFLIVNATPEMHADAGMVYGYVERFRNGNFEGLADGKYFSYYPKLLGLLLYEVLVSNISFQPVFYFFLELCWCLGFYGLLWRMLVNLNIKEEKRKLILLLLFLYLNSLFTILAVYGVLLGCFFSLLAFYCFIKGEQSDGKIKRILFLLLGSSSFGLMYVLKQNYLIAVAAVLILCLLLALKEHRLSRVGSFVVIAVVVFLFSKLIPFYFRQTVNIELNSGTPVVLSLVEGLEENKGNPLLNGSYNGIDFEVFADAGFDADKAGQIGQEALVNRIRTMAKNPKRTVKFFYSKLLYTWNEPTQESILRGSSSYYGKAPENVLLNSLYNSDHAYDAFVLYMSGYDILIYWAALGWMVYKVIRRKKWSGPEILVYLYFLGGFLFYLISETKSSYIYQYVLVLISMSGLFLGKIFDLKA